MAPLPGSDGDPDTPGHRYRDVNVVVDLSRMRHVEKWSYVRSLLAGIKEIRQRHGIPHRIVLDEAYYLLHDPEARAELDPELGRIHIRYVSAVAAAPRSAARDRSHRRHASHGLSRT